MQQDEDVNNFLEEDAPQIDVTPLYKNAQEFEKILFAITQPNNEDLKQATRVMDEFLSKPESIMPLIQQIDQSQKAEVRQVAAVYLREQIEQHWKKIPPQVKENLKKFLLEKVVSTSYGPERLALAAALTCVAQYVYIAKKQWKELFVALEKMCQEDAPVELHEVGVRVFRNLIIFCKNKMKPHYSFILNILQHTINDPKSTTVQVESVKAIGGMVEFLENQNEVNIIEQCIPSMVAVIERCLQQSDEQNVIEGMDVFNDLVESKVPVLKNHFQKLAVFFIKMASAKNQLPLTVRKQAVNFLTWMCKSKPKTVIRHGFVPKFLELCINLVIESQDEDNKELNQKQQKTKDESNINNKKKPTTMVVVTMIMIMTMMMMMMNQSLHHYLWLVIY